MTGVEIFSLNFAALIAIGSYAIASRIKRKRETKRQPPTPTPPQNAALIEALKTQLDATCEYALSLQKAAQAAKDDLKRARLSTQAAAAYSKAAALQTRIDKLTT